MERCCCFVFFHILFLDSCLFGCFLFFAIVFVYYSLSQLLIILYIRIMNSNFTTVTIQCKLNIICSECLHRHTLQHHTYIHGRYLQTSAHLFTTDISIASISLIFPCERTNKKHTSSICVSSYFPWTHTHARTEPCTPSVPQPLSQTFSSTNTENRNHKSA